MKRDGKLPYTEAATLEFNDSDILETTENSAKRVRYADILRIGRTEEHLFLFFGTLEAFVIPLRCLDDGGAALDTLLREKTGK